MKNLNLVFVLILFGFIISAGINIFSKGFLLTRVAQTETNSCGTYYLQNKCLSEDRETCHSGRSQETLSNFNSSANICFSKKSKVIILLVDALKYDFGVFDENLQNPLSYQNRLPVLHELMNQQPDNSRLMKFIADPPTTTLQRLKGMTTGSLPTFIDIGSNFASPEINEDNIIDQIHRNNLTSVFMGDSTWIELFPKRFKRKYSYPSFNIQDLDTTDLAVEKHLNAELKRGDWDFLVAHFLGVDHCGHKHGPLHREMARKLGEMNQIIKNVAEAMDNDTLLLVMGDHGMTITGDHGGDSEDETEALLFAYSKDIPLISNSYENFTSTLQQIDLAPTLAAILGVPVPFSNLGTVNFQIMPDVPVGHLQRYQILLFHLWQNAKQVKNYFKMYAEQNENAFNYDDLDELENKFLIFEHRVNMIYSEEAFLSFAKDLKMELGKILKLCRNIWIKFNPQMMSQGLIIAFMGTFAAFILVQNINLSSLSSVFNGQVVTIIFSVNIFTAIAGFFLYKTIGMDDAIQSSLFCTSITDIVILIFLIVQNWEEISLSMSEAKRFSNKMARVVLGFSLLAYFSNSFVINEQKVLCYLLMGMLIHALYDIQKSTKVLNELKGRFRMGSFITSLYFKLIIVGIVGIVLLRISYSFFKCREEQGNCTPSVESNNKRKIELLPIVMLAIFVTVTRIYLKTSGNLTGFNFHVLLTKYAPTMAVFCACGHFALSHNQIKNVHIPQIHIDALAWCVFFLFLVEILVILINPLLIYVIPTTKGVNISSDHSNLIPELFKHVKGIFSAQARNSPGQIPIIYGLATVYSSVIIAFGVLFATLLALLVGAKASTGLLIIIAVAIIFLAINSILRHESTETLIECLQPKFSTIVSWFLLISFGFYATGHQPTISQIDWNAAFVGRTANFDHSNVLSGLLVILSTFCANFLLLSIYPLVVLFPFLLYAIYPKLSLKTFQKEKKKEKENPEYRTITLKPTEDGQLDKIDFDVTRGEINLFENDKIFIGSVFKVGCQLIILQGLKVIASMLSCTIHCRHLMVWKIFAPRFIYEGITSYISFFAVVVGFLLLLRVHRSVNKLVEKINKSL